MSYDCFEQGFHHNTTLYIAVTNTHPIMHNYSEIAGPVFKDQECSIPHLHK